MRGMPLQVLEAGEEGSSFCGGEALTTKKRKQGFEGCEPRSVLETCRSPSPPTSSSTLGGGGSSDTAGVAAISATDAPWAPDMGAVDWEAILSMPPPAGPSSQEQTFFQWINGDNALKDPAGFAADAPGFGVSDTHFGFDPVGALGGGDCAFPTMIGCTGFHQEPSMEDKQLLFQHQQYQPAPNPGFLVPPVQHFSLPPQPKRHHASAGEPSYPILHQGLPQLHLLKPATATTTTTGQQQQQQQALVDQLFKAAELIEAGNPVSARGILARLNHQLPSPMGKPLYRSAFYFKEALSLVATGSNANHGSPQSAVDVVLKLGTYNAFSEVSPVLQFTNFTCIQALLEELGGCDRIHIIDFDIGVGGQWSSFLQELAQHRSGTTPMLKITAFASLTSHHPLELHLTRENLTHFARDLNIPFEFNVLSLDPFDPAMLLGLCSMDDAIAVNLPANCTYHLPAQTLLRLLKQLSPKIVVSVDNGCDRSDLPFSRQFLHAFQSCTVLLDSIDAAGTSPDVSSKIERFLLQPRIENALLGRPAGDKMVPWRTMFASAGFIPVQFSNFTETQAECLLKRVQVRGFHVEKRQSSLFLCWQRGELVSVSAWRC